MVLKYLLGAGLICGSASVSGADLINLKLGNKVLRAEVAATPDARTRGLMFRAELPAGQGMLFIFPAPSNYCMWMRNTLMPLSVAFVDEAGTILNVEEMQPQTLDYHCARGSARYALEMKTGWFAQNGGQPGSRITGLEQAPEPQ